MNLHTTSKLLKQVELLLQMKRKIRDKGLRREIAKVICKHQFSDTERELTNTLILFFKEQIVAVATELEKLEGIKSAADDAASIREIVYNAADWREKLINRALPVLSRAMGEAATAQFLQLQNERKSTATEWLDEENLDGNELPPNLTTEFPQWMLDAIEVSLREQFEQDYWLDILDTTGSDIEHFIRDGLQEGLSIPQIARNISSAFPLSYSRKRATVIARTESGNALSAARSLAIERVKQEAGEAGAFIKKSWLSVLGNTTRDSHAMLDGVLEDENGMFNLGGVMIPWPSHYSLPPENRINCQCSLTTEFGV